MISLVRRLPPGATRAAHDWYHENLSFPVPRVATLCHLLFFYAKLVLSGSRLQSGPFLFGIV